MELIGRVRNINRHRSRPHLELSFEKHEVDHLPRGDRAPIELLVRNKLWNGTICTTNANRPYLHHGLKSATEISTTTEVLQNAGIDDGSTLRFEVAGKGTLALLGIVDVAALAPRRLPRVSETKNATNECVPAQFPLNDRDQILLLSERYWELISAREAEEERAFEVEMPAARAAGVVCQELLVRLARWKSVRKTPDYLSNDSSSIESATKRAFKAEDESDAISALVCLRGVALRTATALLPWMVPTRYPILDFRVVEALDETAPSSWESIDFYKRIAEQIRRCAANANLDLRTMDRALWTWNKLRSKT